MEQTELTKINLIWIIVVLGLIIGFLCITGIAYAYCVYQDKRFWKQNKSLRNCFEQYYECERKLYDMQSKQKPVLEKEIKFRKYYIEALPEEVKLCELEIRKCKQERVEYDAKILICLKDLLDAGVKVRMALDVLNKTELKIVGRTYPLNHMPTRKEIQELKEQVKALEFRVTNKL